MKKHFIFLLLFPVILEAQPVVTQSEPFESNDVTTTIGLMRNGQSDNLLLVYRTMGYDRIGFSSYSYRWAADVFSPDLKRLSTNKTKKIEFPNGKDAETGFALQFGEPSLVFQQHSKDEKKMHVYLCPIGSDGTIGKPKHICDYYAGKQDIDSKEYLTLNPDSSLLLLAQKPIEAARDEPFSYTILNKEWRQVHEGKLVMPNIDAEILSGDFLLAADTSIWIPVWLREKSNEDIVRQEIWVWRNPTAPPQRIDVSLSDDRLITDMKLVQSPYNGFIYLGGAFANSSKKAKRNMFGTFTITLGPPSSNTSDKHPEQGPLLIKLNPEGTIVSKHSKMFEDASLSYWDLKPADVKKGGGIDHVIPWKILPQPDGSAWLCLEALYKTPVAGTANTAKGLYEDVRNGPAIIIQYDVDGTPIQELLIPKSSVSSKGGGIGHFMLINKGKLAFLYNDNEKNLTWKAKSASDLKHGRIEDESTSIAYKQKQTCSTLCYQDEKNKFHTQKLFNLNETKYWFDPYSVYQLSPTTYIIGCNGRAGVFGLLRVDWKE